MGLRRKKRSIIDQRLNDIRKEMGRLDGEVNAVSRSRPLANSGQAAMLPNRTVFRERQEEPQTIKESPAKSIPLVDVHFENQSSVLPDADLFTTSVETDMKSGSLRHPAVTGQDSRSQDEKRKKFANYFTAGNFHDLRPLRQENRILRNKAIVMIILVVLAAFWLFCFLNR